MTFRAASAADADALRALHLDAFDADEGPAVAGIVVALLSDPTAQPLDAFVAEDGGALVGSVLFSAATVGEADAVRILAPLAVAPAAQGRGVGGALVRHGLAALRAQGVAAVCVLGDPAYYGRFGFDHRHGIRAPYPPPMPEAWMALALGEAPLPAGDLRCARALDAPEHW